MIRHVIIENGSVDVHHGAPVRRQIDIVLQPDHRCPEAVIADVGSQADVVIQCERDGGHEGNHHATTERGAAEWSRIENTTRPDGPEPF